MKFNSWEQTFRSVVEEAERWVSSGNELEIVHWFDPGCREAGYYAYEYDGEQSVPIYANDYDKKPLISDKTVEKNHVNVVKVLDACGVYYSEC